MKTNIELNYGRRYLVRNIISDNIQETFLRDTSILCYKLEVRKDYNSNLYWITKEKFHKEYEIIEEIEPLPNF